MQCSISECRLEATRRVQISFRETRNLCERHYRLFMDRDRSHPVSFARASSCR